MWKTWLLFSWKAFGLDQFDETLHLRALPKTVDSPDIYLARWEFQTRAEVTEAFGADQFDLFPSPIGKLLNAHPAIGSFEATLTRGRWKSAWGEAPWEFRPPGAVLATALTEQADDPGATASAYRFLVSTLAGSLCASFEGMNPALSDDESQRSNNAGARPLQLPAAWSSRGTSFRLATLPYEPVCTENLTPWLKLLPCGRHRGLAALLSSLVLEVAESPLASLTLAAQRSEGEVVVRASLDVVLPGDATSLPSWLDNFAARKVETCVAAGSSQLAFWWPGGAPELPAVRKTYSVHGGQVVLVPTASLLQQSSVLQFFSGPWVSQESANRPRVMRDMLSQEGRSERTHGRYLLRVSNPGRARYVRLLDQLPFFIRPLWHSIRAVWVDGTGASVEVVGADAMKQLQLEFTPSDGLRSPTDFSLSLELKSGGSVSVFLDVLKNFINFREFSYACEKGFDVGGAVWLDDEAGDGTIGTSGFAASLGPTYSSEARPSHRLHFTEGMIVMVPMPDFSMPFNVVALSSTAATFFFGSVFRMTAASHAPHWCSLRGAKQRALHPLQVLALLVLAGCAGLNAVSPENMLQLQSVLSQGGEQGKELYDYIALAKDKVDSILAKR